MATDPRKSFQEAVAFGQKLEMLLQTWVDLSLGWGSNLRPILSDISTTCSVMQQLQNLVYIDQVAVQGQPAAEILTKTGHQELETLAIKCNLLYKIVMLLLQRAADKTKEPSTNENVEGESLKSKLLMGSIPDPSALRSLGILRKCDDQEHWLDLRLDRCKEQLRWVKQALFIILHVVKLARLEAISVDREDGTFEQEAMGRAALGSLRNGSVRYTKRMARKQEKATRQWELRAKSDTDNESVSSSASSQKSATTASTAVDSKEAPEGKGPVVRGGPEQGGQGNLTTSLTFGEVNTAAFSGVVKEDLNSAEKQRPLSVEAAGTKQSTPAIGKTAKSLCSFSCNVSLNMKLPNQVTDWTHRIFGKDDVFKKDWESKDLEAYIYESMIGYTPHRIARKIPFGHRRLHYGLDQLLKDKDKSGSTWNRYIDLGPTNRWVVDEVVREANKLQTRERVCIAFQEIDKNGKDTAMLIFFSIREEKQPIFFKDAVGRQFSIPYERGKTLDKMRGLINDAFLWMPDLGPHVLECHYDFIDSNGDVLLPGLWKTIKPGDKVSMRMWPPPTPLRVHYGPPPYLPTPGRRAPDPQANYQAMMRMRRIAQYAARDGAPLEPPIMPPPPMMGMPPPGTLRRIESRSIVSVDDDAISQEEDRQLMIVDFVEENEKMNAVTTADLLARFTNLKDTLSQDCLDGIFSDDAYNSDGSYTSSYVSSTTIDD